MKQTDKFISKNIMIDPSLLGSEELPEIKKYVNEHSEEFDFFISESFYQAIKDISKNSQILSEFFETKYNFKELNVLFDEYKVLKFFSGTNKRFDERFKKYDYLYDYLTKSENATIRDILYEEGVFLQEHSWIISKSKKTFEKFKESGSVALEFSKEAANKLIRKQLHKKDDEFLKKFDILRVASKWVALGVGNLAPLYLKPEIAPFVQFASNGFLLLDP